MSIGRDRSEIEQKLYSEERYIPSLLILTHYIRLQIYPDGRESPTLSYTPEGQHRSSAKKGINQNSAIVVYDRVGIYSGPRAWCMFRAMGHDQVAVLDGGLPAWIQAGYEIVPTLAAPSGRGVFASRPQGGWFVDSSYVLHALTDPAFRVIDARSEGRFKGLEPEPREGLRLGHMPNAVNIPFTSVLEDGKMLSKPKLESVFDKYKGKKMIFSCGSGVTACVVALAAEQAGQKNLQVYDGSWSEWGLPDSGLPVEAG